MPVVELSGTSESVETMEQWIEQVSWDDRGLVPVIAQDWQNKAVLMMAWMNREALEITAESGNAVYWSRSRGKLWRKGESSGHVQHVRNIRLDCDGDTVLLEVEQQGGIACHTGRAHCFYRQKMADGWESVDPVVRDPKDIYG